jgi:hypothetical protein
MNKTRLGKSVLTEAGVAARATNAAEWEARPPEWRSGDAGAASLVRCTCGQPSPAEPIGSSLSSIALR